MQPLTASNVCCGPATALTYATLLLLSPVPLWPKPHPKVRTKREHHSASSETALALLLNRSFPSQLSAVLPSWQKKKRRLARQGSLAARSWEDHCSFVAGRELWESVYVPFTLSTQVQTTLRAPDRINYCRVTRWLRCIKLNIITPSFQGFFPRSGRKEHYHCDKAISTNNKERLTYFFMV